MRELWRTALCGSAFGAALTYSGVFIPEVIMAQMKLESFHMMRVFLTATASSAIVLSLPHSASKPNITARGPTPLPRLGPYGGNILGGILVGFGMTLAGACPGTVFVQVGAGVPSSLLVLAGSAVGGVFFQAISGPLRENCANDSMPQKSTIPDILDIPKETTIVAYVALCAAFVYVSHFLEATKFDLPSPVVSGLFIGGAQFLSVLLRGRALGVSGVFSDTGKWFWDLVEGPEKSKSGRHTDRLHHYPTPTQTFATGLMLGSLGLSLSLAGSPSSYSSALSVSTFRAIAGGFSLAVGALMGGGCTSGHGISGMALLGISSVVSVASMFAGGIALAQIY